MNKHMNKQLTVAVLAKNEEKTAGRIIKGAKRYADEVILIDGHSKDKTRKIAEQQGVKVFLDHGKGKGDGIRTAIKAARREILVLIDADGSHDPQNIPQLVKPILEGKVEHVSGSRATGGSDELYGTLNNFFRKLGNDIITLGINYRFGVRLTESQNGFRAVKTAVAKSLNLQENITTIEQEMIIKTLRKGYRIAEVPTHEYKRLYGKSVIQLRKVWWRYVYTWLKYLFF